LDLDDILPVENFSDLTIQTLADRLQRTRTAEQCIYRETELDEVWRLIDIAVRSGDPDGLRDNETLRLMRDAVHRAHDLVGMDNKPLEAAAALREVLI
jgi:site-specific recombinase XerC